MNKKALALNEIIAAITILAMAIVPLWGLFTKRTTETLYNASKQYASNKASEILSAMLDNVPFAVIKAGNPGLLTISSSTNEGTNRFYNEAWLKKTVGALFPNAKKTAEGYLCSGTFKDEHNICYTAHLRVEDIRSFAPIAPPEAEKIGEQFPNAAPKSFIERNELTFAFLKAPSLLYSQDWAQKYTQNRHETPFIETDLTTSGSKAAEPLISLYEQKSSDKLPYGYVDPTAFRLTQRGAANQAGLGETANGRCLMKRLVLQVEWSLNPTANSLFNLGKSNVHRLHLITLKADLD